jgi:hypothetical protein
LQDSLEQHWPLGHWPVAILLGKAHHCVLDDIQRGLLVSNGKHRLFEGATLDAGKEIGKFGSGTQGRLQLPISSFSVQRTG